METVNNIANDTLVEYGNKDDTSKKDMEMVIANDTLEEDDNNVGTYMKDITLNEDVISKKDMERVNIIVNDTLVEDGSKNDTSKKDMEMVNKSHPIRKQDQDVRNFRNRKDDIDFYCTDSSVLDVWITNDSTVEASCEEDVSDESLPGCSNGSFDDNSKLDRKKTSSPVISTHVQKNTWKTRKNDQSKRISLLRKSKFGLPNVDNNESVGPDPILESSFILDDSGVESPPPLKNALDEPETTDEDESCSEYAPSNDELSFESSSSGEDEIWEYIEKLVQDMPVEEEQLFTPVTNPENNEVKGSTNQKRKQANDHDTVKRRKDNLDLEQSDSAGSDIDSQKENNDDNDEYKKKEVGKRAKGSYTTKLHTDGRKVHRCCFCNKWVYKLSRHIKMVHKKEEEVEAILKLPRKQQNAKLALLRRKGDFDANMESARESNDLLVVVRNGKNKTQTVDNYTTCMKCFGMYNCRTASRHMKICQGDQEVSTSKQKVDLKTSRIFLQRCISKDDNYADLKANVFSRMANDHITNLVKNDDGLILYGFIMYEKRGDSMFNEISNKLRNVARLIIEYRKLCGDSEASSLTLIDPANWDRVVQSVKKIVSHKGDEAVGTPSLLLRLGRSLESLACTKRALGIKTKDRQMVDDARDFLELHSQYWNIYAGHAVSTLECKKDKTPELLPLTKDLKTLRQFLTSTIDKLLFLAEKAKANNDSFDHWSWLQKLLLVRIITFNARRGGEAAKIEVSDWQRADQWKRNDDIEKIKDPVEKLLADRMKVVYIKGKRKRRVPILFTEQMQRGVDIIIHFREAVGVSRENQFIFARPTRGSTNPIRGWDAVHDVTKKIKLEKPHLITSTKIRKEMATVLQLLDMNDAELNWVTDHLGHSADVHKKWYRQEESTVELTKVAKLLVAKDQGKDLENKKIKDLGSSDSHSMIGIANAQASEDKQVEVPVIMEIGEDCDGGETPVFENDQQEKLKRREGVKVPWTPEELDAVKTFFKTQIAQRQLPNRAMVEAAQKCYKILQRRKWLTIRSKVHYIYTKAKDF